MNDKEKTVKKCNRGKFLKTSFITNFSAKIGIFTTIQDISAHFPWAYEWSICFISFRDVPVTISTSMCTLVGEYSITKWTEKAFTNFRKIAENSPDIS